MATYSKYNAFVEHLHRGVHNLWGTVSGDNTTHTVKAMLINAAPTATHAVKADVTEIGAGNGYTAGGTNVVAKGARASGTYTLSGQSHTWTASGGTIGPFQTVVLYNDTPTSPADPLIGAWDRGAALTLQNGESFSVKYNDAAVGSYGDIYTLA